MKELKNTRKTRYTQMVLKDSLVGMMWEKPISKITVKELCERADINRTTFYAHYSDPYALLKSIEDETLEWAGRILAEFSINRDKANLLKNIEKVFYYLAENSNHIQVLMSEQGDIGFQKKLMTLIYEQCGMLPAFKNMGLVTNELYLVYVVSGSVGLIQHWLKSGLKESPAEMAEILFSMISGKL